ncbi:ring-1,2-phenylacetyl-CoA epoxidase subunit PaaB [Marininema mesophilum]|uniref:Ring-1,2-phenylacetyl-CoA epoxidase subunit PaaB n=1 Tax=Marininema mesophilum TaxID=1048340 RepID=A0A1H3A2I7_9BACL|nr:phenylacetic acid degradation protein [Marininema mesophilum]SDX23877.1 ring-1,2-phenylacetyl-CoA epoxidase subunit PaaB [Marininema mesophilum]
MKEHDVPEEYEVFEVFVQKTQADFHTHVGSIVAPSPDVALMNARENFLRRESGVNLWVVPRQCVTATPYDTDVDWFAREMDRKYREAGGYPENGRLWKMYKERVLHLDEIVEDLHGEKDKRKNESASS